MINPCREFDHILKSSKCVLFAGGTMKPLEEFQILLITTELYLPKKLSKITTPLKRDMDYNGNCI
jgi:Rad3-related DNA helicase